MPIILTHSFSHSFAYTDANGDVHEVNVTKGQDIEPFNIPPEKLATLMSELVVTPEGYRFPRYTRVAAGAVERQPTYSTGAATKRKLEEALSRPEPGQKQYSDAELQAMILQAAEEEAAANAEIERETQEATAAALEQAARESKERAEREAMNKMSQAEAVKAHNEHARATSGEVTEEEVAKTRAEKAAETRARNKAIKEAAAAADDSISPGDLNDLL